MVDNEGHEIFADKVGVMLARDLSARHPNAVFVADVKSTGLFTTDPVLRANGARALYWKTGHSYMKRYTHEQKALVGFEKSGHFFFQPPLGRGYDDGLVAALAVCDMLDRNPRQIDRRPEERAAQDLGLAHHVAALRRRGQVRRRRKDHRAVQGSRRQGRGRRPARRSATSSPSTACASRSQDGTWGLVRASSNKPELVVVVESPTSEANMRAIFADIDARLAQVPRGGRVQSEDLTADGVRPCGSDQV